MTQIIPAILATTEEEYQKRLQQLEKSGLFKDEWVHIDFMDNKFVQNKSVSTRVVLKYPTKLKVEAHLMVINPYEWVNDLVKVNAKRIIAHTEIHFKEIERFLDVTQDLDVEIGLALNSETEVDRLEPYIDSLDCMLVMGVHPGFQGQDFIPAVLNKISKLKKMRPEIVVGVDGGVRPENVKNIVDAGADYLVIGSALFEYDNLEEGLERIWEKVHV